jgi:2-polyprenyl-6-hydroxyphenyl methylase/3-demethylubiquinone-9 3-methyltransferase
MTSRTNEKIKSLEGQQKKRIETLFEYLNECPKGKKILDIGCQSGWLCDYLHSIGFEPSGMDIEEELINNGKRKYAHIDFRVADAEVNIPFPDEHFDYIFAGDVIEHVRFTDHFIHEVNRILKKSGVFILTTPNHSMIKNILIALFRYEKHYDPEFPHYRFYTIKSLKNVLIKRGFRIETIKLLGSLPFLAQSIFLIVKKVDRKIVYSSRQH